MIVRGLGGVVLVLVGLVLVSAAPSASAPDLRGLPVVLRDNNFCFNQNVRIANITILGNRCYTTYLVRTSNGNFLGFGPAGKPLVAPGRIAQLNYVPGQAPTGGMLHLLRLNTLLTQPVNTFQFVLPQFSIQNGRLVINVPVATGQFAVIQSDERLPGEHSDK
jgi:hypothetical protein